MLRSIGEGHPLTAMSKYEAVMGVLREQKGSQGGTGGSLCLPPPAPKPQSQQHLNTPHPTERNEEQGTSAGDSSEEVFNIPSGGQAVAQLAVPPCLSVLTAAVCCRGLGGTPKAQLPALLRMESLRKRGGSRSPPAAGEIRGGVTPGGWRGAVQPGSPRAPRNLLGRISGAPRTHLGGLLSPPCPPATSHEERERVI